MGRRVRAGGEGVAATAEHWSAESDRADVVHLDIPAHATRERRFEIFCMFQVRRRGAEPGAHAMRVLVNGAQEWARRVSTHEGPSDVLDLRLQRIVPIGRPLRITALGEVEGAATALHLAINADEDIG